MTVYYRRTTPGPRENLGAGLAALGLGAGVAAVTFYLARLFLARESFPSGPHAGKGEGRDLRPPGEGPSARED